MKPIRTKKGISELKEELDEQALKIPYTLASTAFNGSTFDPYRIEPEDSDYTFLVRGTSPSGHVIADGPKDVEGVGFVVIIRPEEEGWYVPCDVAESNRFFPTVKQNFHTGNYKEREKDYIYVFPDGLMSTAMSTEKPVPRMEDEIRITNLSKMQSGIPNLWVGRTESGDFVEIRERSGHIHLKRAEDREKLFKAFIGGAHPGTTIYDNEILSIVSSMDYISIDDSPDKVPKKEIKELHN